MAAILKVYTTTSDRLPQLEVNDGQLIFVRDTKRIYLDSNSLRVEYSVIQTLETEEDRENLSSPAEGFYFVEETSTMWRYKNKWIQINSGSSSSTEWKNIENKPFDTIGNNLSVVDGALSAEIDTMSAEEAKAIIDEVFKDFIIGGDSSNNIYIGPVDSFPAVGEKNTLYVSNDTIYLWNEELQDYIPISNKTEWTTISKG